jgi:hypothetical protein
MKYIDPSVLRRSGLLLVLFQGGSGKGRENEGWVSLKRLLGVGREPVEHEMGGGGCSRLALSFTVYSRRLFIFS